jgi:predicted glycoside hydrolase/deacetylase ChbG (UPF0249 family)
MAGCLAKRLGFAATDRVAVVHCDDIGMCHAANEGAFEALARGPATCGSLMVPCPWFPEAAERARSQPELDLGVHLTLNAEWVSYRWGPAAGAGTVPSLVDADGYFFRTTLETVKRGRPEEVERELRTQVERALAAGIDVTHLDTHMGTCIYPPFLDVYLKLARDYRLPVFAVRPEPEVLETRGLAAAAPLFARLADALESADIPVLDGFDDRSLHFAPGEGAAHNARRLAGLGPGVSYLICHPARGGEELDAIGEDAHMRDFERRFYGGEEGRRALAEAGVKTVGMRALRDLVRSEAG